MTSHSCGLGNLPRSYVDGQVNMGICLNLSPFVFFMCYRFAKENQYPPSSGITPWFSCNVTQSPPVCHRAVMIQIRSPRSSQNLPATGTIPFNLVETSSANMSPSIERGGFIQLLTVLCPEEALPGDRAIPQPPPPPVNMGDPVNGHPSTCLAHDSNMGNRRVPDFGASAACCTHVAQLRSCGPTKGHWDQAVQPNGSSFHVKRIS
ncbi:hypothetical protein B0T22DRAFT_113068 [Podospora appendiculata]|uniref:Uncharacterized protein n=1 Tax=Podospora appendiculata TaxID=314037 RepID=A0AAE0XMJ0_9PEZI|nr:hypothetical protein B0T22DRAFT_113068 [Podospora appendiculata]